MRVPLSWLREFTDCELSAEDIARRLTLAGLEVEAIERIGVFSNEVRVARIESVQAHPAADRLKVVDLDVGADGTRRAITGAPNVTESSAGRLVPAALPGAILIEGDAEDFDVFSVEPKALRGTDSDTVLCSGKELGLSDDHEGILFLDLPNAKPGDKLHEHASIPRDAAADIVLEVAILPNYGRCLSIIGMARELAALTRSAFRLRLDAVHLPSDPNAVEIEITAPDLCPRYTGAILRGITVRESPPWLKRRLVLTGHKPINCVVDITNYVMVETGEPMHAFDLDRLPAPSIRVRRARAGETIATLDQKAPEGQDGSEAAPPPPRELDSDMLLITSGDEPVAVAGVIGGLHSQIHDDTRSVLLEAANFDATSIRKTSARLKVMTESSYRFSREVDPNLTIVAIQRAAFLLREIADAEVEGVGLSDQFPGRAPKRELDVRLAMIRRSLGMDLAADEIASALSRLGFEVEPTSDPGTLHVEIPGFRNDVAIEADIAEEVIRVIGFDRLKPRLLEEPLPRQRRNPSWEIRRAIREYLAGAGLQEIVTYSLTHPDVEEKLTLGSNDEKTSDGDGGIGASGPRLTVLHPSTKERSSMRRTLLSGLLEIVARNHRERRRIALFEVGLVWRPEAGDGTLPAEIPQIAIALSGPIDEPTWADASPRSYGFFELKGLIEGLLDRHPLGDTRLERHRGAPWHPGIAARLIQGERTIGFLGEIHPSVLRAFDIEGRRVVAAVLDFEPWVDHASELRKFTPLLRFPPVRQDLSLVVAEEITTEAVENALRETAGPLLLSTRLADLYRGPQVGEGRKSLSFRLEYGAPDRSLTEEEVNAIRERILPLLRERIGAEIR